jgi:signal transduction histidine kinase
LHDPGWFDVLLREEAPGQDVQYVRGVRHRWPLIRRYGPEALIVLLVGFAALELEADRAGANAPRTSMGFGVAAVALMVLPLFVRRRFPFGASVAYWLLAVVVSFVDGRLIPSNTSVFILGMVASYLLGNLRDTRQAGLGLAVSLGGAALVVANQPSYALTELIFIPLLFGSCWLAGFVLRERARQAEAADLRATQAERDRDTAARIAVAEERTRIARELHDIVAHAVSVMVLQVGAVRHRLPDTLAEDRDALTAVEQAGRTALAEMRRLLAAMRGEGEEAELMPQPGLDGLDALVDDIGRAGLPVRLHVDGEPVALPRAIDLSAYRIVQEGLTNALRHADASHADVTLDYEPGALQLEVRDDGAAPVVANSAGHGLLGIRERVKIYGGDMSAGPAPAGGFVLSARLPLEVDAR